MANGKNTLEEAVKKTIIHEGIVPYEQQTPEQRRELVGRINSLLDIRILRSKILDNWAFIEGSIPQNPQTKELKILRQRLNKIKKIFRADMVPFAKEAERVFNLCLTASGHGTDQLDNAAHFASEFLKNVHKVSVDKLETISWITQDIVDGKFEGAITQGIHENEMMLFGQYCLDMFKKGRRNVTQKDLEKFKNRK